MPSIAMFYGMILAALGVVLYVAAETKSVTALIPSFFGLALIVLGLIARMGGDKARMHCMHVAALVGLVGMAFPGYRAVAALANGTDINLAIIGQLAMAVLCGIFLVQCIKSFIDARAARRRAAQEQTPPVG